MKESTTKPSGSSGSPAAAMAFCFEDIDLSVFWRVNEIATAAVTVRRANAVGEFVMFVMLDPMVRPNRVSYLTIRCNYFSDCLSERQDSPYNTIL